MNIGILGSGVVAQTIGTALVEKGHQVMLGSRSKQNEKAMAWVKQNGSRALHGMFDDAARFGELLFLCLNGAVTSDALQQAGCDSCKNKVIIDVTNPLDFSHGMPPSLLPQYSNTWSLGEEVQKLLPDASVVKALNTVTARLMVNANLVNDGHHHLYICGNDADAKIKVKHLLAEHFYWKPENIIDMGSIQSARLTEAMIPFWVGVMNYTGTAMFNFQLVK